MNGVDRRDGALLRRTKYGGGAARDNKTISLSLYFLLLSGGTRARSLYCSSLMHAPIRVPYLSPLYLHPSLHFFFVSLCCRFPHLTRFLGFLGNRWKTVVTLEIVSHSILRSEQPPSLPPPSYGPPPCAPFSRSRSR